MEMSLNITATVHYGSTKIISLGIDHKVIDSKYNVSPYWWNMGAKYFIYRFGSRFTVENIVENYLGKS